MWFHTQTHRTEKAIQTQVMIIPPCPGRVRNEFFGNFLHVHMRKEPKRRTQHNNTNRNQGTCTAEKEDNIDFTAIVTTAAFTSIESKWDNYITEGLAVKTTLNNQIYVVGKKRWVKPARKWRTPTSQVCKEEKQSKLDVTDNAQARTINGMFMFGSAARNVTETKGSLPALQ